MQKTGSIHIAGPCCVYYLCVFFRTYFIILFPMDNNRTESSGIFGEVGFKIAPFSFLTIVPMVGVGGLTQTFNIRARSQDVNFDSLLIAPGQNASITSGMKLAGLAALELGLTATTTSGSYGVALRAEPSDWQRQPARDLHPSSWERE